VLDYVVMRPFVPLLVLVPVAVRQIIDLPRSLLVRLGGG
jgi:hypothetical protein